MTNGENTQVVAAPRPTAGTSLITLPQEVLDKIANHLHGNDKIHLALCCKALLPILGMGHVRVNVDKQGFSSGRALLCATRCLMKQPSGASHLEVLSRDFCGFNSWFGTRNLINLSLLTNLRKLTLFRAAVSLPALQLVATRLHGLNLVSSRLQGSADGFLTRGWTALTRLSLAHADMEAATMTAAPELPALEELNMKGFRHQGGALQLDQLIGGCPHVRGLSFLLDDYMIRGREGSRPCGSLQSLGQLADLCIWTLVEPPNANFDLPAGLTHLQFADASGCGGVVDFFLALNEAAKCIRRGVHLRKVTCLQTEARLQPAQWGASLDEQYRRLGLQLTSLTELEVKDWCQKPLLSAVSAIVSSAPSLTRLILSITSIMPNMQLPAISSSSLESVTLELGCWDSPEPHPPVVLTFLPGCTRLQQVLVRFCGQLSAPTEGTAVEIRCHSASPMRIMPPDGHGYAGPISGMGVQFHPMPPSSQWVQAYTVIYTCHVALKQDHFVMPDVL